MNKKEQLKRLICALYRQDEPEDYTDECMEDMLDNIDFEVLLQAVAHSAKTVPMKPAACRIAASTIAARRCSRKKRCGSMRTL